MTKFLLIVWLIAPSNSLPLKFDPKLNSVISGRLTMLPVYKSFDNCQTAGERWEGVKAADDGTKRGWRCVPVE
jgi:hypothetical protein